MKNPELSATARRFTDKPLAGFFGWVVYMEFLQKLAAHPELWPYAWGFTL